MSLSQRIKRARKAYLAHPSDARLRVLLVAKSRLYLFDKRIFAYYNVDPKVNRGARRGAMRAYVAGLVPTATTGGKHAPGSFHYQRNAKGEGRGLDLGLRAHEVGTPAGQRKLAAFQRKEYWRKTHAKLPNMAELIGPTNNLVILAGKPTKLAEGSGLENQHDNHVHEGYWG